MTLKSLLHKLNNRWKKFRLRPIRVFCFHQVSDTFDESTMWSCDWTQIDILKRNLERLKERCTFIPLSAARHHMQNDWFRFKRYAVLTADDGYKSISNILPWLQEKNIPITLFINTKYLDGQSWSAINEEQARRALGEPCAEEQLKAAIKDMYLTKEDLFSLTSPLVEVALHGHEHLDATNQSEADFIKNVEQCYQVLQSHPRFVPFFAYTWGHRTEKTDKILHRMGLTPVLVNGDKNYNNTKYIDRECLDGKEL